VRPLAAELLTHARTERELPKPGPWAPAPPCPPELAEVLGLWWLEADEIILSWRRGGLHAHMTNDRYATETGFRADGPGRYRTLSGRFQGELLVIDDGPGGAVIHWATYRLHRTFG
jgi:hypothetical protein